MKKIGGEALHVGFTNSLPQAAVASAGSGGQARAGAPAETEVRGLFFFDVCVIPRGLCLFATVWLEPTRGTLLLAFASH